MKQLVLSVLFAFLLAPTAAFATPADYGAATQADLPKVQKMIKRWQGLIKKAHNISPTFQAGKEARARPAGKIEGACTQLTKLYARAQAANEIVGRRRVQHANQMAYDKWKNKDRGMIPGTNSPEPPPPPPEPVSVDAFRSLIRQDSPEAHILQACYTLLQPAPFRGGTR